MKEKTEKIRLEKPMVSFGELFGAIFVSLFGRAFVFK